MLSLEVYSDWSNPEFKKIDGYEAHVFIAKPGFSYILLFTVCVWKFSGSFLCCLTDFLNKAYNLLICYEENNPLPESKAHTSLAFN